MAVCQFQKEKNGRGRRDLVVMVSNCFTIGGGDSMLTFEIKAAHP